MKDLYAVLSTSDSLGHQHALMSIVKAAKACDWFPDNGVKIESEHLDSNFLRVIVKMPEGFFEPSQIEQDNFNPGVAIWFSPSPFGFETIGEA